VLIDGIPVIDANIVMSYDPLLIKTISLVTQHYYYGGLETDGIISIETYEGDAKNVPVADMVRMNYVHPQASKIYYTPNYDGEKDLSRIPDFRTQLYWNPAVSVNSGSTVILTFYTADVNGKYLVEVAGVTSQGESIYKYDVFNVK
jgi:hypothetical protein